MSKESDWKLFSKKYFEWKNRYLEQFIWINRLLRTVAWYLLRRGKKPFLRVQTV